MRTLEEQLTDAEPYLVAAEQAFLSRNWERLRSPRNSGAPPEGQPPHSAPVSASASAGAGGNGRDEQTPKKEKEVPLPGLEAVDQNLSAMRRSTRGASAEIATALQQQAARGGGLGSRTPRVVHPPPPPHPATLASPPPSPAKTRRQTYGCVAI